MMEIQLEKYGRMMVDLIFKKIKISSEKICLTENFQLNGLVLKNT